MTQASFNVEVIGEVVYKSGRRICVTNRAIPENLKLLIEILLSEGYKDVFISARCHEELLRTYYKIFNLL